MKYPILQKFQFDVLVGCLLSGSAELEHNPQTNLWRVKFFLDNKKVIDQFKDLKIPVYSLLNSRPFVMLKYKIFKDFIDGPEISRESLVKLYDSIITGDSESFIETTIYTTYPTAEFQLLAGLFYKKNNKGVFIKRVPENISELLNDVALSYFWMDSGVVWVGKKNGFIKSFCRLQLPKYSDADIFLLKSGLEQNFGVECLIEKDEIHLENKYISILKSAMGSHLLFEYARGLGSPGE